MCQPVRAADVALELALRLAERKRLATKWRPLGVTETKAAAEEEEAAGRPLLSHTHSVAAAAAARIKRRRCTKSKDSSVRGTEATNLAASVSSKLARSLLQVCVAASLALVATDPRATMLFRQRLRRLCCPIELNWVELNWIELSCVASSRCVARWPQYENGELESLARNTARSLVALFRALTLYSVHCALSLVSSTAHKRGCDKTGVRWPTLTKTHAKLTKVVLRSFALHVALTGRDVVVAAAAASSSAAAASL